MGNKSSILRSSSRADESNATPRVAVGGPAPSPAVADIQQPGAPPSGPVAKLLTANIASIRPVEQTSRPPTPLDQNQFTRILLKLPQAADAFNSVRTTFHAFDKEKKGYIEFSDLSRVFEQLGANFSGEEIGQVFQESDMMENGKLTFKEFLVCLAIGFVLHGNKLRIAFQLAVDAFLWFDVDGNGVINRVEMATKLQSSMALHSPTKKMSTRELNKDTSDDSSNQAIWEQRFMEMDWNGDGNIHFKEFLMAFESWMGLEDDDSTIANAVH
uniref:Calmodulin n=1 Tax=Phytophthora ramorum TaxID=164328 RepID=H3HCV0_PHYRM